MLVSSTTFQHAAARGFIVLEGVNGAGKSTLIKGLAAKLGQMGKNTVCTREPGATQLGKTVRSLVLEPKGDKPSAIAELMLFGSDRAEHVAKVIKPNLEQGNWVISDRYLYSSIAFQGFGRQLPMQTVELINSIATTDMLPDLVIVLDLDPAEGLRRAKSRDRSAPQSNSADAFEREELAFHTRIREGFLQIAKTRPEPFFVVDASQSPEQVLAACWEVVAQLVRP